VAFPEPDSPYRDPGSGGVPGEEASPQFHQFVSVSGRASGQLAASPEDFAATACGGPSRKTIKAATPVSASAKVIATTPTFSKGSSAILRLISPGTTLERQARYLPHRTMATAYTSPDRAERANSCTFHTLPSYHQNRRTHSTRPVRQTASLPHNKKLKC
jgi:hypothetical protein